MRPCRFSTKLPMTSKKFDRRLKRFFLPTKREFRSKRLQIKRNGLGCEWVGISGMGLAIGLGICNDIRSRDHTPAHQALYWHSGSNEEQTPENTVTPVSTSASWQNGHLQMNYSKHRRWKNSLQRQQVLATWTFSAKPHHKSLNDRGASVLIPLGPWNYNKKRYGVSLLCCQGSRFNHATCNLSYTQKRWSGHVLPASYLLVEAAVTPAITLTA